MIVTPECASSRKGFVQAGQKGLSCKARDKLTRRRVGTGAYPYTANIGPANNDNVGATRLWLPGN
jgi:hypothetical protein